MFALRVPPPEMLEIGGKCYRLRRVFKHDFWAATCLYEIDGPDKECVFRRIVVKFGRMQGFWGLPLSWVGTFLRRREELLYAAVKDIKGIPRWVGPVGRFGYAIEYIDARPLDHPPAPPEGFFDRLREIFDTIHSRGVAYCDANKRSNILIGPAGEPYLIDFQISIRRRDELPPPLRTMVGRFVDYMQQKDIYHLYKLKRRTCPDELTADEEALSRHRTGVHLIHRKLTKPYRVLRRWALHRLHAAGRLASPTESLEDHYQPEKESWRK